MSGEKKPWNAVLLITGIVALLGAPQIQADGANPDPVCDIEAPVDPKMDNQTFHKLVFSVCPAECKNLADIQSEIKFYEKRMKTHPMNTPLELRDKLIPKWASAGVLREGVPNEDEFLRKGKQIITDLEGYVDSDGTYVSGLLRKFTLLNAEKDSPANKLATKAENKRFREAYDHAEKALKDKQRDLRAWLDEAGDRAKKRQKKCEKYHLALNSELLKHRESARKDQEAGEVLQDRSPYDGELKFIYQNCEWVGDKAQLSPSGLRGKYICKGKVRCTRIAARVDNTELKFVDKVPYKDKIACTTSGPRCPSPEDCANSTEDDDLLRTKEFPGAGAPKKESGTSVGGE